MKKIKLLHVRASFSNTIFYFATTVILQAEDDWLSIKTFLLSILKSFCPVRLFDIDTKQKVTGQTCDKSFGKKGKKLLQLPFISLQKTSHR